MLDIIEANRHYSEYKREVKQEQLYRQLTAGQPNLFQQMLKRLGDFQIASGRYSKTAGKSGSRLQRV